jgi:hypothetical protein
MRKDVIMREMGGKKGRVGRPNAEESRSRFRSSIKTFVRWRSAPPARSLR